MTRTLQRAEQNKVFLESLIALEVKKRAIEQDETLGRAKDFLTKRRWMKMILNPL